MNCEAARKITDESLVKNIMNMCPIINPAQPRIIGVFIPNRVARSGPTKLNMINATPSAVSHQLRILKTSKLVRYRKEGNTIYYALDDDHVKKIFELGCEHINEM